MNKFLNFVVPTPQDHAVRGTLMLLFLIFGLIPEAQAGTRAFDPDGIATDWRTHYFGLSCSYQTCSAVADPDGDGANNLREYMDGTDPTNPASVRIIPISLQTYLGSVEGGRDGDRTEATFSQCEAVQYDSQGRLWITEARMVGWDGAVGVQRIRLMDINGKVRTVAGSTTAGFADGFGSEARFRVPQELVFDSFGNALLSDRVNNRIRKISPEGYVSTYAGGEAGNVDGPRDKARFSGQIGIDIDSQNNLFVADFMNNQVRKISSDGMVSTIARIAGAHDVVLDEKGTLYVAGWTQGKLYQVSPSGQVTIFADSVPYATYVERDKQGRIYATTGSPVALHCYSPTGNLLWRVQCSPGTDYLPSTPAVGHIGKIEFLANGNILFPNALSHQIMLLRIGPEPMVRFQTQAITGGKTNLIISTPIANGQIHFSLDGSDPTLNSSLYTVPLSLELANRIKARVFVNGLPVSELGVFGETFDELTGYLMARRELPDFYRPGISFHVTITTTPAVNRSLYAVEDRIPSGWSAGDISHGGTFDAANHKVKFGPFFDHEIRMLTYSVTAPANSESQGLFQGVFADDALEVPVSGDHQITRALYHPADNDPADGRITLQEMTRYAGAWRMGQNWPLPPNPIPINYVTRSASIWKSGETYFANSTIANLPDAWTNKSPPAQP